MEVRDRLLGIEANMPKSQVNKEYYIQNQERRLAELEGGQLENGQDDCASSMFFFFLPHTPPPPPPQQPPASLASLRCRAPP